MYSNKKFYLSKYIFWRRQNILRWIELGLCIACLTLAVIIFYIPLHITTRTILLVVNAAYLFITFIDVISWIQLRPMGYKTWILFATGAFLMFWLCGGLLAFVRIKRRKTLMYACALYFVTGVIFLLDCLWVIMEYISWTQGQKVTPVKEFTDRAVSTCCLFEYGHYEGQPTKKRSKCPIIVKPRNLVTVSYGGTFPVSKDQTPLPSPDTSRSSLLSSQSWRRSSVSIASRDRACGDTRKEFRPDSRQKSADHKTRSNLNVVSIIEPVRPVSCRPTFYDAFNARLSHPSTAQSLSRISEKTSKDSLHFSYEASPREQDYNNERNNQIGAQACECPLVVTCEKCLKQPQRHRLHEKVINETRESTVASIPEEAVASVDIKPMAHKQFDPKQESEQQSNNIFNNDPITCDRMHHDQQRSINVAPYYCKCNANKKEEVMSPQLSSRNSFRTHMSDHQDYRHEVKTNSLESELDQYNTAILIKRNGLDPDDHPKYRLRPFKRLSCQSCCNNLRPQHDSSTTTDIPPHMEKSSGHTVPTESHFTQVQPSGGIAGYCVAEKSTSMYEELVSMQDVTASHIDAGIMATKETTNVPVQATENNNGQDAATQSTGSAPVQAYRNSFRKGSVDQSTVFVPPHAEATINPTPHVDDPLAFINSMPHLKFFRQGKVNTNEQEMETSAKEAELNTVIPKAKQNTASAGPSSLQLESVGELQPKMDYKLCYKPCHHPPVCPICFAESKIGPDSQGVLIASTDAGVNTEAEKKFSFFRRKKK